MKLTNALIGILGATFVVTIGIIAAIIISGNDPSALTYFIGVVLGAAFPGILNGKKLGTVEKNTNGTLSAMLAKNDALSEENAKLTAIIAEKVEGE